MPTGPITRRFTDPHRFGEGPAYLFRGRDDENLVNKALVMTKWTGSAAAFKSMIDIVCVNVNKGLAHALSRIIVNNKVMVGTGLSYMAALSMAANLRKKNDPTNHLFAGVGAGLALGGHFRSIHAGINYTIIIGLIGYAYKIAILSGGDLFPDIPENKNHGFSFYHKTDFTMMKNRPGYWVKTQEEADEILRTGSRSMLYDKNNLFADIR